MKALEKSKKINYRHFVCIALTIGFLLCAILFQFSYLRLIAAIKDFGTSIAYFFCKPLGIDIFPSVTEQWINPIAPPDVPPPTDILPETPIEFQVKFRVFLKLLINEHNIKSYLFSAAKVLINILEVIFNILPFILVFILLLKMSLTSENNNYNKNSKPLQAFKSVTKITYYPAKKWITELVLFIKDKAFYWKIWLVIWLLNFNIITIAIEFLAFYFYFSVSFDIGNIYIQIKKLLIDLVPLIKSAPVIIIAPIIILNELRKNIGYKRLEKNEKSNVEFLNTQPICLMFCGTMGSKKTTIITDIALTQQKIFKDKALELLIENDMKFPCFPWINFENALKKEMAAGAVFNLYTAGEFVKRACTAFENSPSAENCFSYDYLKYGMSYYDGLTEVQLFKVLENYAKEYFIYVVQSTLIISNHSIRTDDEFKDKGNFPLWDTDYFRRKHADSKKNTRFAHILDFDMMRLGKTLLENNKNKDAFEFGVIVITEVGKERGNKITNEGVKKTEDSANQKNDKFEIFTMLIRHPATVENFPFVRILVDDQRPESLAANSRELCNIIHIDKTVSTSILMPFYFIEEFLFNRFFDLYKKVYLEYRHHRGDNILIMHILNKLTSFFYNRYKRISNTFASTKMLLKCETGTNESLGKVHYYLSHKKIYSERFSTDCYSDFFREKVSRATVGFDGITAYKGVKASFEELNYQNSYFITELNENLLNVKTMTEKEMYERLENESLLKALELIEAYGSSEKIPKELENLITSNKDIVKLSKEILSLKMTNEKLDKIKLNDSE